ncbi:MAG: cobyric acid synthase [Deltaproteobacteria bacterium]|nr:cobyric acid synthase [Deltaproteobacteria bacterium]
MPYRPLMVLGSGSDVGKSVLVAGLCRIFRQEGIRVAPFKAQNMALNSFITPEGGEMGRAQVVQAQAAGLAPHVDMNPILLKPTSQVGSQVIVRGKVYGNFPARDYYRRKPRLVRTVMESYRRLSAQYDLIVLEGAGSAVELNLKRHDLVNFAMARRAGARVLLVADIDRGGVFAATIGAFHLMTPAERRLLAGFVINKFRGDPELFRDGVRIIETRTRRPVLGVLPYDPDLALPEEDSVALGRKTGEPWAAAAVRIAVLRLPHLSNYTDFDPLEQEPGVALRYLDHRGDFAAADVLIIPGTKNTISDLRHLKETGLAERIRAFARRGGRVVGICGGYQILGEEVQDPLGVEGPPRTEAGLGLLPVVTVMAGAKTTSQVRAHAAGPDAAGSALEAYEIHMGETRAVGPGAPAFVIVKRHGAAAQVMDGWAAPGGRVWGAYLHGLFDNDGFRRSFLGEIRREGGAPPAGAAPLSFRDFLEAQLDRLAALMRRHLDMELLMQLIQPDHDRR